MGVMEVQDQAKTLMDLPSPVLTAQSTHQVPVGKLASMRTPMFPAVALAVTAAVRLPVQMVVTAEAAAEFITRDMALVRAVQAEKEQVDHLDPMVLPTEAVEAVDMAAVAAVQEENLITELVETHTARMVILVLEELAETAATEPTDA